MTYKVEFEVNGNSVFYTVKAQNVLEAEEKAKEKMCADPKIQSGSPKGGVSSWEVKHIENTP
jgi:hypothetical protein